ncbi:MAG: phage terminase large subunit [Bacteroides sp.]|uniref:phage terminase large subunit n=1 Tax=Bacteroides sp. TaxID=29523 RepID=UPI002FC88BEF
MASDNGLDLLRAALLSKSINFTKYFFRQRNKRKFVVNQHHEIISDALDLVLEGKITRLIINIAPRYSKTELAIKNFMAEGFALNPSAKFIHLSYSDDLAKDNSNEVRELVKSAEYQQMFPWVRVSNTTDSKKKWNTTEGGGVYAVASGGQVTGFGAGSVDEEENDLREQVDALDSMCDEVKFGGAILIDDPIKPDDAQSETKREFVNNRFESTIRNRVNSRRTPIVVIMQRLHERDLCGHLMEIEPGEWTVISLPVLYYDEDGKECALWPFKHTVEELHKLERIDPYIFQTQYLQNPQPKEGLMYGKFKTYGLIPATKRAIKKNYTDTADTGKDYLCSIDYVETEIGNFFLDVLYTPKAMEYTEPATAQMMSKNGVAISNIESNNGGRGFARNVESQLRLMGNNSIKVNTFHQSDNKKVRIFTRSAEVMNLTYLPEDWEARWPEWAKHIKSYRKDGVSEHDDAEDALTGTVEMRGKNLKDFKLYEEVEPNSKTVVFIVPDCDGMFAICKVAIGNLVYVTDVVFSSEVLLSSEIALVLKEWDIKHCYVESGKAFFPLFREVRESLPDLRCMLDNGNKEQRITAEYANIKRLFRFRTDYEHSIDYRNFMENLADYEAKYSYSAINLLSFASRSIIRNFLKK